MISVFKSSESVTAPEGQYNQPTTLGAGRGVSKRCEQFHRAAAKDMFGVNLKKNQFVSETSIWRAVK